MVEAHSLKFGILKALPLNVTEVLFNMKIIMQCKSFCIIGLLIWCSPGLSAGLTDSSGTSTGTQQAYEVNYSLSLLLQQLNNRLNAVEYAARLELDTAGSLTEIQNVEERLDFVDLALKNAGENFGYRLLKQNAVYLDQLQQRLNAVAIRIRKLESGILRLNDSVNQSLMSVQQAYESLDSMNRKRYVTEYDLLIDKARRRDSLVFENLDIFGELLSRITVDAIRIADLRNDIGKLINTFTSRLLIREEPPLLSASRADYSITLKENAENSWLAAKTVLMYYLQTHWLLLALALLICAFCAWWISQFAKGMPEIYRNESAELKNVRRMMFAYPGITGFFLGLTFTPYLFPNPPMVLIELWFGLQAVLLVILLLSDRHFNQTIKIGFLSFLVLFRLIANFQLLLSVSFWDRWILFITGILCLIMGVAFLYTILRQNTGQHSRLVPAGIIFFLLLITGGLVSNLAGNYRFSVFLSNTAVFSLYSAITLLFFYRVVSAVVEIRSARLVARESALISREVEEFSKQVLRYLAAACIIGWLLIIFRRIVTLDALYERITGFLFEPLKVGRVEFSVGNILIFILVIWLSVFLSRLVSYVLNTYQIAGRSGVTSNYRLVLKLAIIISGVLLAFMASGIPMNNLVIILGSLGVGIGFGLQHTANNLISGIMIILERPISVGDSIQINNHTGLISEIGLRATKLQTVQGSEVIIPNGDLLTQSIVNWTSNNPYRRFEFRIEVDQTEDINRMRTIIQTILNNQPFIRKSPTPTLSVESIHENSVELVCRFWCHNREMEKVRGKVMEEFSNVIRADAVKVRSNKLRVRLIDHD
jgi:small-conductance mechanosensitive channel